MNLPDHTVAPTGNDHSKAAAQRYTVAVRAMCEFTAKQGSLDLRFTPSATALEGVAGQNLVVARRRSDHNAIYEAELSLSGDFENLHVRGRADGYDAKANRLEEIKSFRGDLNAMPENRRFLHWAQVKVYGALLCQSLGLREVNVALVYFDVGNQEETVLSELMSAADLQAFFEDQCRRFAAWAAREQAHRLARDAALDALKFPHAGFRTGQRPLSEAVFKAATAGRCLLAQAPTGIGKTVGTLFPLLKAVATQRLDKVFYLAAKTPGRGLALEALQTLQTLQTLQNDSTPPPLRVLELVARDNSCEHPDKACHGESCPLANGFFDRLPSARIDALTVPQMDKAALRSVALQHQICPYHLAHEMLRWSDVVVGDYNYYFDVSAMLFNMTLAAPWRVGLLVDEAHNLIDRARKMYSAELGRERLNAVRLLAPTAIKASLNRLLRSWLDLENAQAQNYTVLKDLPASFIGALNGVNTAFSEHLAAHPEGMASTLLGTYFDTLHFARMCESFGEHSLFDITLESDANDADMGPSDSVLCLRNIVPAPHLKARFAFAHTATLFSATLSPTAYQLNLLGLPEDTLCVDVASPFSASQLSVQTHRHISTRYTDRSTSVQPIVDLMARQFAQAPGNYLAFFSSFDYLQKVALALQAQHPELPMWEQSRGMLEAEREQFLARFTPHSRGIAFAVLGGAFAEGIDLPGRRLIGAFIATLGLPQVNPVNEQIKDRMQDLFGAGEAYAYAYLYPGLQKVVQAAGRIIRTTSDQGCLHLMDDRFARADVKALFPKWWRVGGNAD